MKQDVQSKFCPYRNLYNNSVPYWQRLMNQDNTLEEERRRTRREKASTMARHQEGDVDDIV